MRSLGLLVDGEDYYRELYRAASAARRYIFFSGWQFDSAAPLLRGKDAEEAEKAGRPVAFLPFLEALCNERPELTIHILAWDFHGIFAFEREWMQKIVFDWMTHERLHFRFDSKHVDGASHHQKFVVIDGQLSFLGGLDVCDHRWDDRRHLEENPLRVSRGSPHKPFHDVQAYLLGREVAADLGTLFAARWHASGGEPLEVPAVEADSFLEPYLPIGALSLESGEVALSRTDPNGLPTGGAECREVETLFIDGITSAERRIYVETQYFSSRCLTDALIARFDPGLAPIDVVLVLNMKAETLKEEVAIGLLQAKMLGELRVAADGTHHRLGIYYTVPAPKGEAEPERATYIHSKLMIVDDRFMTIGSANMTNRSCGIDTELNLSVETDTEDDALARSIVAIRRSLLAEHLGDPEIEDCERLVSYLDDRATRRDGRLRLHPSPTETEKTLLAVIDPAGLPFDPSHSDDERDIPTFVSGIGTLWQRIFDSKGDGK